MAGGFRDDFGRELQVASAVGHIRGMARHVAERTGTEVPPAAPLEVVVDAGPEFALGSDAEPAVPIDLFLRLGDLLFHIFDEFFSVVRLFLLDLFGVLGERLIAVRTLSPNRAVRPDMNGLDFANDAGLDLCDAAAHRVKRGALVAHLGADAVLLGEIAEVTGFADRTGQRLLRIGVLAGLNGGRGNDRVHMVGRTDRNGVDLIHHFREEFAIVGIELGIRIFEVLSLALKRVLVGVAQRDDFAVKSGLVDIAGAFAANADTGDRESFQSGSARDFSGGTGGDEEARASDGRRLEEVTT